MIDPAKNRWYFPLRAWTERDHGANVEGRRIWPRGSAIARCARGPHDTVNVPGHDTLDPSSGRLVPGSLPGLSRRRIARPVRIL